MNNDLELACIFMYEYAEDEVNAVNMVHDPVEMVKFLHLYKNESLGYLQGTSYNYSNDLVNNAIEDLNNHYNN